ncbi:MAG: hypothetical protein IPO77_00225 [Acidobacteria bacterium]|nr:hypothetical protein [Acidobacteriota bacterium]
MPIRLYMPETRFAVASVPLEFYTEVAIRLQAIEGFVSMTRDKEEVTVILAKKTGIAFPMPFRVPRRRLTGA